eukprot:6136084-Heterocapsa_arctica.AAC.1
MFLGCNQEGDPDHGCIAVAAGRPLLLHHVMMRAPREPSPGIADSLIAARQRAGSAARLYWGGGAGWLQHA